MSAMLLGLVDQLADEIRLGLPTELLAPAELDRDQIAAQLWKSGALDRPALVSLLLRRADEQLVNAACRGSRAIDDGGTVERLVGDSDGTIASAAMALAVARGRRRDRFGHLGVEFDDVPQSEAKPLVHLVAAAIRDGMSGTSVEIDEALSEAAERVAARHHERRRVEGRALELAEVLVAARGADDDLIAMLAAEGDAAMIATLCAVRAGIAPQTAWMLLIDDGARDAMLLARLAGLERPTAAALVAALALPLSWGEPSEAIACFDRLTSHDIDAARRWWRLPPAYRDGILQGGGNGQSLD